MVESFELRLSRLLVDKTTELMLRDALKLIRYLRDFAHDANAPEVIRESLKRVVRDSSESLEFIKPEDAPSVVQHWAFKLATNALAVLSHPAPGDLLRPGYREHVNLARELLGETEFLLNEGDSRDRSRRLVAEISDSLEKAQTAAGVTGALTLASYFGGYATEEKKTADRFRFATIVGIGIAIIVAIVFAAIEIARPAPRTDADWVLFASHVTIVLGIGALTAYLGRQSGQHRRMYNWARSMEVQLKSFPAFIEPLEDEVQADLYRVFARRVLAAPPDRDQGSDDAVPTAQVLDVVLAALKRVG